MYITACLYIIVSIKRLTSPGGMSVVDCTDLSGKEPHRYVGIDKMVTSGSVGGVIVGTLVQNARDVAPISTLGTIFPIFITP